jgi:hypothetical protein
MILSYHEIMGQRYRLLDLDRLCWRLRTDDLEAVRQNLAAVLEETIVRDQIHRQACWTESLAVGSIGFVEQIQPLMLSPRETGHTGAYFGDTRTSLLRRSQLRR